MRWLFLNLIQRPSMAILAIVLGLILYLLSYLPRALSGRFYHSLARLWCRFFLAFIGIELHTVSRTTSDLPARFVLISNHPSVMEDFIMPALFDVYPLAKAGVRDWYFLGRVSEYAGTIFVQRGDSKSRHSALLSLIDAAESGKNIYLFPEGGCFGKYLYHEFKTGAFETSLKSGVPVLPVYLHYHDPEGFEWTDQSMPGMIWQVMCNAEKRVDCIVHDPIYPDAYEDKQTYAAAVYRQYEEWQRETLGVEPGQDQP